MHPIINTWITFWHFEETIKRLHVFQVSLDRKEFNHLQYFYTENRNSRYLSSAERYSGNTSQGKNFSTAQQSLTNPWKGKPYNWTMRNSSCLSQQTGSSCLNVPQTTALGLCFSGMIQFSGAVKPSILSITTIAPCSFIWAVQTAAKQWVWYTAGYLSRYYGQESFFDNCSRGESNF